MVMGTTGIKALLYELAFTATRSLSDQCCEVKQQRARLPENGAGVTGWLCLCWVPSVLQQLSKINVPLINAHCFNDFSGTCSL